MALLEQGAQQTSGGVPLDPLYARNPGTKEAPVPEVAPVSQYEAAQGTVSEAGDPAGQMARITSQSSPMMQRAKQQGMLTAARRGLQNTSIAAGTAQGAMVDRAMPLAQQAAQQEFTMGRENVAREDQARQFEAQSENVAARQQAELSQQTQAQNTEAFNRMQERVLQANVDVNKQYLVGEQAADLTRIQGENAIILGKNQAAAQLYQSTIDQIGNLAQIKDLTPQAFATKIGVIKDQLQQGLNFFNGMEGVNLNAPIPTGGAGGTAQGAPGTAPGTVGTTTNTVTTGGGATAVPPPPPSTTGGGVPEDQIMTANFADLSPIQRMYRTWQQEQERISTQD